jgi:hypothetical protein
MIPAWLLGMQRHCQRRFADCEVDVSVRDMGAFCGVMVKQRDGWRHTVAVCSDDSPRDVADSLEKAVMARRMR